MSKLLGWTDLLSPMAKPATTRRALPTLAALALLAATSAVAAAEAAPPAEAVDELTSPGIVLEIDDHDVVELGEAETTADADALEHDDPSATEHAATTDLDRPSAFAEGEARTFGANDRVWVDKGCGATYALGDAIRIYMRVDQNGYYDLRVGSSSGARTYRLGIPAGRTVYLSGTIGQPTGRRTLRLTGANTNVTCTFQVGATAAPQPPTPAPAPQPSGGLRLTKLHAADDLLRPTTCLGAGSRVYFVTEVRNDGAKTMTASVAILSKGMISSWWLERIETFDLAPGESRQVLAYADEYRAADYGLRAMILHAGAEQDVRNASFKIGSCP